MPFPTGESVTLVIPDVLDESCATRQALERLAAKWRVLVIYALLAGPQRHAELRRRLPGITQKVLTETLRAMEIDGLVERRVLKDTAPSTWNTASPHWARPCGSRWRPSAPGPPNTHSATLPPHGSPSVTAGLARPASG